MRYGANYWFVFLHCIPGMGRRGGWGGGMFDYTLSSANELGQTGGGGQVVHGAMEREGKAQRGI